MDNKQASQKQRKFIFSRGWFPALIVLIILATIGSLFYIIDKPESSKPFSEFFLLDQNGKTTNYPVILTVGGKPVAALVPIENADLETVTLSTHPKFLALIERSRTRQKSEGGISSAEMHRRLGIEPQ